MRVHPQRPAPTTMPETKAPARKMARVPQSVDSHIGGMKAVVVDEGNVVCLEVVVGWMLFVVVFVVWMVFVVVRGWLVVETVGIVGSVGVVGVGTVDMVGSVEVVSNNAMSLNLQMKGSSSLQSHSVALQRPFA